MQADPADALVETSFLVMGILTEVAGRHGLSLTQLRVFGITQDREPRLSDLAAFLGLDKSTVTGLVDRAAARGLVERVRHESDARSVRIRLTDAGRELATLVHGEVHQELAGHLGALSPAARKDLTRYLRAVVGPPSL
ncbi:MarR family transcriptional regulator [Branchiibius sp. NY16-3462-2]|uniref:MarR family winged helix-turn-helix transcriptional regulator n=1 Tax=Branchiibius sp. NY16-3462-2 TaxID=1807500 RepID=UPI0025C5BE9E|nr:MarR family transcriptional regulator [Branchiibius sp. NY16-3462-2]